MTVFVINSFRTTDPTLGSSQFLHQRSGGSVPESSDSGPLLDWRRALCGGCSHSRVGLSAPLCLLARVGSSLAVGLTASVPHWLLAGTVPQFLATWAAPYGCTHMAAGFPQSPGESKKASITEARVFDTHLEVTPAQAGLILSLEASRSAHLTLEGMATHKGMNKREAGTVSSHPWHCRPEQATALGM